MLSLPELADPEALHDWAEPETVRRGLEYARAGRVARSEVLQEGPDHVVVSGTVQGTTSYRTSISFSELPPHLAARAVWSPVEVDARCTCPVRWSCKHCVATVVDAARNRPQPSWRSALEELLEGVDERLDEPAPPPEVTPVALMVVLPNAQQQRARVFATQSSGRPRLSVRLSRRGRSGRWVKGGFSWRSLATVEQGAQERFDPQHVQLLRELQVVLQGNQPYWSPGSETADLHTAGPALWPLLERIRGAGIPWVCSERSTTVEVAEGPASLELDLAARGDGVAVRSGASHGPHHHEAADIGFIGEPAHGVVLWRTEGAATTITLARLPRPVPRAVRTHVVQQRPLVVPTDGVDDLLADYLPRLRDTVEVRSRDGSVPLPDQAEIHLRGQLVWHEDASAELAWRWVYDVGDGHPRDLPVDDRAVGRGTRDLRRERELLDGLPLGEELAVLLGLGQHGPGTLAARRHYRGLEAMDFQSDRLPELVALAGASPAVELVVLGAEPEFRPATGAPVVRFTSSEDAHREGRTDWLELEVVVVIEDVELGTVHLGLAQVLAALASGRPRVEVRRGVYVDLDRPELDQLARLVEEARAVVEQPREGVRLSRHAHDLLADLEEIGPSDERVRAWSRAAAALRDLGAVEPPPEPAGLQAVLRPYQRTGFGWLTLLHEHGLGGVLADDMGLGKTLQTLAMVLRAREQQPEAPPFLVVAPSSVLGTWVAEAERFAPGLRVLAVTESASRRGWSLSELGDVDLVVTSYTLLRLEADSYAARSWAGLVLDEAQLVKNAASVTHASVRRIEAWSRFAITGTPMENNLMELWSILSLVAPGLFPHFKDFQTRYAQPIEQEADGDALARLRRRIAPVMLRRTKEVVAADLPAKQEQVLSVELGPRHRQLYDTHLQRERQRILKLLEDLDENRLTILASLTRLRQLSLDPALVDEDHADVGSAKIDLLVEHLTEIAAEGHRALVFSQFTGFLGRVRQRLDAEGIGYRYLDGRTRGRPKVIDGFRSGDDPVFLISLRAGGVGLTLTEADYCFLLDPWWNPAVEAQAVDRTHRIGQTRNVNVYRLVSEGTIEEKVMELARRKAALFASVVDADSMASSSLSADDIAALLGS